MFLRSVTILLLIANTLGRDFLRSKNVHCDVWTPIRTSKILPPEEPSEVIVHNSRYNSGYYGGYNSYNQQKKKPEPKVQILTEYYCTVRNYEFAADREYYINDSEDITQLTIEDSSMENLPLKLLAPLVSLKKLTVTNTTLKHVDSIKLRNLTTLDLSANQITSLDEEAFAGCTNLTSINLSSNKIHALNGEPFTNDSEINMMDLSKNNISGISDEVFLNTYITNLNLAYNSFKTLRFDHLANIENCKTMNFSHNKIELFHPAYYKLLSLDLSFNELIDIDFRDMEIEILYINDNKLKSLSIGNDFTKLIAYNNHLEDIFLDTSFNTLEMINLNNNSLGDNLQDICKCTKLEMLFLNSNNITDIGFCFAAMKTLKTLKLARNQISQLNHDSFHMENQIEELDLSHNQLEFIDEYTLSVFQHLEKFLLNGNQLFNFYDNPKYLMPYLNILGLSHNKFKCSKLFLLLKNVENQSLNFPIDDASPVNTTNIQGMACFQNHEGELYKDSADVITQSARFFWQKLGALEATVKNVTKLLEEQKNVTDKLANVMRNHGNSSFSLTDE
ncbi:leucine-rich repeat-containing G-protein coupled receptor 4-like [Phlebotomus argentipes]|uniref:leucine-rich repeat-containing G-protein coupled receptor 4-like n=1 Tax=Phlebotomus argentipes TaxID=94469 RepID=UPI0028937493|nr:leucine-rich repeat-containing G-protein coupled receptor 4-like [Phlebotomus argentipes]